MKVYDGGLLKFNLNHSYTTGLYDIVMRYEPNEFDRQFVSVKIKDMSASSRYGIQMNNTAAASAATCLALARGQREIEQITIRILNSNFNSNYHKILWVNLFYLIKKKLDKKHVVLFPAYCFQALSNYELELSFNHKDTKAHRLHRSSNYNSAKTTPSILIDSVI